MVNVTTRVLVHLYIIGYWKTSAEKCKFLFFFLGKEQRSASQKGEKMKRERSKGMQSN